MKTSYHIGEMAQYFGVSTDALRLYDKKGILSPCKQDNGYRVYSREDMIFLDYVIRLRRLGLPLKEIKRLVDEGSILEAERVIEARSEALLQHMNELRFLYDVTQDYRSMLRETRENLGDIRISTSPRMIYRPIGDSFIRTVSSFEKLSPGLVPRFCVLTTPEDVMVEGYEVNVYDYNIRNGALKNAVVVIDRENKVAVPPDMRDEFFVIAPQKCVYMAARCHSGVDYEAFIQMRRFVINGGYTIVGDMISVFVAVRCGRCSEDDFYQVYIPIA